jgi:phosphate transport system protein
MNSHQRPRTYDADLATLGGRIAAMGGHAERMVDQAVSALVNGDEDRARAVVADDLYLDESQRWIDERAMVLISRRQPVAADLREIIGSIRISSELERVGDLGKNIAKRVPPVVGAGLPVQLFRGLEAMAEQTLVQLKQILDVYASRSIGAIGFMRDRDEEIDAHYTSLFREILSYMTQDPANVAPCTHLLFCAKNIERIGDHATNIAETVHYVVTGNQMPPERRKVDRSHQVMAAGTQITHG